MKKLLRMRGWKIYTNGTEVKFKHKCGFRIVVTEQSGKIAIFDIVNHVC